MNRIYFYSVVAINSPLFELAFLCRIDTICMWILSTETSLKLKCNTQILASHTNNKQLYEILLCWVIVCSKYE